jgi:hypothetical protein
MTGFLPAIALVVTSAEGRQRASGAWLGAIALRGLVVRSQASDFAEHWTVARLTLQIALRRGM